MRETVTYSRDVPVARQTDVLVVGGGPAGIAAAIAAARGGARTLLLERFGFLGGNATASLVGPFMTCYSLDGEQQLVRGIYEEMVRRLEAVGGALHPSGVPAGSPYSGFIVFGHDKVTPFDPEAVKVVALEMCREAGVELQFHTFMFDTLVEDGRVAGVYTASKSGLEAIRAKVTVDCSADGDVAARAGAEFDLGRDEDGLTQPMTLFFRIADVDDAAVDEYVLAHPDDRRPFASIVRAARERGEWSIPREGVGMYKTLEPGVWRVNTTRILRVNGTDVRDLSEAEQAGREQMLFLLKFMRANLPGLSRVRLYDSAAAIGVRETRRIRGEYEVVADDLIDGREFDDVIAMAGYPFDIHSPSGSGGGTGTGDLHSANIYQVPYRALVPAKTDGVLVAGRCISATHEALAAIRVMPPCFALGEAAGAAAAIAVRDNIEPRQVPVPELQATLVRAGAYLGETVAAKVGAVEAR